MFLYAKASSFIREPFYFLVITRASLATIDYKSNRSRETFVAKAESKVNEKVFGKGFYLNSFEQ